MSSSEANVHHWSWWSGGAAGASPRPQADEEILPEELAVEQADEDVGDHLPSGHGDKVLYIPTVKPTPYAVKSNPQTFFAAESARGAQKVPGNLAEVVRGEVQRNQDTLLQRVTDLEARLGLYEQCAALSGVSWMGPPNGGDDDESPTRPPTMSELPLPAAAVAGPTSDEFRALHTQLTNYWESWKKSFLQESILRQDGDRTNRDRIVKMEQQISSLRDTCNSGSQEMAPNKEPPATSPAMSPRSPENFSSAFGLTLQRDLQKESSVRQFACSQLATDLKDLRARYYADRDSEANRQDVEARCLAVLQSMLRRLRGKYDDLLTEVSAQLEISSAKCELLLSSNAVSEAVPLAS